MENKTPISVSPAKPKRWHKKHTLAVLLGGILAFVVIFVAASGLSLLATQKKAMGTLAVAQLLEVDLKNQDLVKAKEDLVSLQISLTATHNAYSRLAFWGITPLRAYYQDGQHAFKAAFAGLSAGQKMVTAVEPYADVLGLKGKGSFTGGTAEDRIVKIIQTAGLVAPVLDSDTTDLEAMQTELNQIKPTRYPFAVKGKPVSDYINAVQTLAKTSHDTVATIKPALALLPTIAGLETPQKYLMIFQNDGELRPTGGFMTAYSVLKVDKGKITPEKSDDIYALDSKFTQAVIPPDILKKYLLSLRWNLRDMNVSPDFKTSMAQFLSYYRKLPGEGDVNGVVAIDTQLLSDLVSVLGPVDVPGFGRFTADNDPRCNCPNIIYNLEDISTKPTPYFRSDRKAILGPMMATILQKAYSSDNKSWPVLFQTIWKNVSEKHVLFYFSDPATQKAAEGLQVAGQVNPPPPEADYFMVVDANLGGAKSNMFVSQSVDQDITVSGGKTMKKVTIIYKNPQPGSNCNLEAGKLCLNGRMPSWVRIYVPKGSTLVDAQGFDPGSQQTTEELGYTVFGGVYKIDPQSLAKIELTYTVPYSPQGKYSQVIQKQAGTKAPHYLVKVNGTPQEFDLIKDQTVTHTL